MTLWPLVKKDLLEIIKTKKLLILIIIFLFVAISSPIIAKLIPTIFKSMPEQFAAVKIPSPTWRDAIDQFVKNLNQIGIIIIIFMFAGTISEEKNKKTLEMILSKPVSRSKWILAKFLASSMITLIVFWIFSLVFWLYTYSLFGYFSLTNFLLLLAIFSIFIEVVLAITIFSSVLTTNQISSAGIAFVLDIIVYTVANYIKVLGSWKPGYVLGKYSELMANGFKAEYWQAILSSIIIVFILLFITFSIFKKQEVER